MGGHARRLAPLMTLGGFATAAEAGVGLALLLQLQGAGLEVWQIALVYLPGGIALTILPRLLHGVVQRWGRRPAYLAASLATAVSTAALALSPPVILVAALWIVVSAALALLYPLQKTLVTEASGRRVARGMSCRQTQTRSVRQSEWSWSAPSSMTAGGSPRSLPVPSSCWAARPWCPGSSIAPARNAERRDEGGQPLTARVGSASRTFVRVRVEATPLPIMG